VKTGVEIIAEERKRQMEEEGLTAEQGDQLQGGQLAGAAACYAWVHANYMGKWAWRLVMALWPWPHEMWRPQDPISDLAKAGALIAAEIDRLQRRQSAEEAPRLILPPR